jgi:hypothetical protein
MKMKLNINFKNLILFYCLFLIILPNDFYSITSIYDMEKPPFVHYYLYSFYFSMLYLPIVIGGIVSLFIKKNNYFNLLIFFFSVIFIKDIFLYINYYNEVTMFFSWELYFQVAISLCFLFVTFSSKDHENNNLWLIFSVFTILGVYISAVTGLGTGMYEFENRYTAPNLSHGETSYLITLFVIYLVFYKRLKYKSYLVLIAIGSVILTGSRKDLIYIFLFLILFLLTKKKEIIVKVKKLSVLKFYFGFISGVTLIVIGTIKILTSSEFDRIKEPFYYLFRGRLFEYILTDSSGLGRIDSFTAAINILVDNPLGLYFSFFNSQMQMQLHGYPTFAHSTLLFYTVIIGLLIFPIALFLLNLLVKLIKYRSNFLYPLLYFILYNSISGGALLDYKVILINIFFLGYTLQIVKKEESIHLKGVPEK